MFCLAATFFIGIIGAGIGGSSAAYFLQDLADQARSQKLEIDIFEKSSKSGGRLALVDIDGRSYEAGGSIIHPKNFYMNLFVDKFGLKKRSAFDNGQFGIFDGRNLIFQESSYSIITILKMFYKYGLDPYFLQQNINNFAERFDQIYHLQKNEEKKSFQTVKSLLENIYPEFWRQMDTMNFNETLTEWGLHQKLANEIIEPIIRVNYGQGLNVHGFVGSVAVAGAHPGLWAVSGGNRLVTERLLEASKAKVHFNHLVTSIFKNDSNNNTKFTINCQNVRTKSELSFDDYDYVIVASPLTDESNLEFHPKLATSMKKWPKYHKLYVYFIRGNLRPEFSHLTAILSCCNYRNLNSLGLVHPVNSTSSEGIEPNLHIWKIFSNNKIDINQRNNELERFFVDNLTLVDQVEWLAYPQYETDDQKVKNKSKFPFEISDGIFYINAVESAASAMEMSAVGAKNVAILIFNKIFGLMPSDSRKLKIPSIEL